MSTSPYHIASLLDKMTSSDKDFRFMATNDLMAELQKDSIKLDDDSERKVVQMLLKLLEDKNGEVQNLAVKCLGPLVSKVKEHHVETIVDSLCSNMLSDNEQLRDISSIGLKTVIGELPPASSSLAANICRRITGRLTNAISKSTDVSVQLEALDILGDLLSRFGGLLVSYHQSIQQALLPQLTSARLAVRKRTIIALGHLVLSANSSLFVELMDHLLAELKQNASHSTTRTFIQCIGAICRQAGHRVGEHLERIIPMIVQYSKVENDDELREYCIQAFESFVCRCPKEVTPYIPKKCTVHRICENLIFSGLLVSYHQSIQQALLPQLTSARLAVRKRTIIALGHLVLSANSSLFVELMDHLLAELKQNASHSTTRTFIQCIGAICRQAGHRVGEHLERIIPMIVQYSKVENDDELREYCIQAFESFVCRCPKEVTPYIPKITELCLDFICYDPNYNYGSDDEDEFMETDIEDDEEEEEDDDYSDDDDMSWKVRRSAAKCLSAVLGSRPELLSEFYKSVSPALIARFKEREENVKADIFAAYITLLRQTRPVASQTLDADDMEDDSGPVNLLTSQIQSIVRALHKQLREKSVKTRQGCFHLLLELVAVLPGALSDHISAIVPGIQFSLGDKSSTSNMKIDTLAFLGCILAQHPPKVFHPHIHVLVPPVVAAVGDPFYKITSEALMVTQQLVKVIRPHGVQSSSFEFKPYVRNIYQCTLTRLKAADIDQEVKERAISCMCVCVCWFKSCPLWLSRNLVSLLSGYLLTQENISGVLTEVPPLISESDLHISQVHTPSTGVGLSFMITTCINSFAFFPDKHAHVHSTPFFQSCCSVLSNNKILLFGFQACSSTLPAIMGLIRSPLLQGGALNATLTLLTELVMSGMKGMGFKDLFQMLVSPIYSSSHGNQQTVIHKQAFHSIAKCVAALAMSCPSDGQSVVNQFVKDIQSAKVSDPVRLFSLLSLGEIGRHIDLSSHQDLAEAILDCFSSPSEEIKSAASFALGKIAAGNLKLYLPFLLKEIQANPKRQYLLLHSLKEVISCEAGSSRGVEALKPFIGSIWTLLFSHCESTEEGTRNVVAECLGKLTLVDPLRLLPQLKVCVNPQELGSLDPVHTTVEKFENAG
ncbi:cullin-associated NEDD8-dissociated protein 1-like [Orbicella faveolata]|uniref:cullin-associated NEDD8-dissociated protein 1-like n=1 Tax=Orbicella faveolata TaxID=48498 RepID=UPI0009E1C126|nr:cullin-associated NEDD8-dissociated protein 1-like [Orbicella faveolata]